MLSSHITVEQKIHSSHIKVEEGGTLIKHHSREGRYSHPIYRGYSHPTSQWMGSYSHPTPQKRREVLSSHITVEGEVLSFLSAVEGKVLSSHIRREVLSSHITVDGELL